MINDIPRDSIEDLANDIKEAIDLAKSGELKKCKTAKVGKFLLIAEYGNDSLMIFSFEEKLPMFKFPELGYLSINSDRKIVGDFNATIRWSGKLDKESIASRFEPKLRVTIHLLDAFYATRLLWGEK